MPSIARLGQKAVSHRTRVAQALVVSAAIPALVASGQVRPAEATSADPAQIAAASGWELADEIRERVRPPVFPDREVDVADFGADPTGEAESTEAFRAAIEQVSTAGGGRVTVPAGTFLTGAIHLQSNVDLHLTADAVVRFSQDPADYLPVVYTRWEGVELFNYSPFIYAYQVENVAITGTGTLDGQADSSHWWDWGREVQLPDRADLFRLAEEGVPVEERVFGGDHFLRPNFVQFYESRNILVQGVTLTNSPMWTIHPVLSENVTVDGVNLATPIGLSTDGVNPESSRDVVIKNSRFNNNDDNIAIKSGRDFDGRRIGVPSENIVIENNRFEVGHGAVSVGSEMSGSVRNVFAQNNVMDSAQQRVALRIKTSADRGGVVEDIYFRNNDIHQLRDEVVRIDFFWERGSAGDYPPIVRDFYLEDVHSTGGNYGLHLRGYEHSPISNINISNSTFDDVGTPMHLQNVQGLRLTDVTINGEQYDTGHVCDGRVWVDTVFTGVTDRTLDDGSCLSEQIAGDGTWHSPEQFAGHVRQVTSRLRAQGAITGEERTELVQAAERPPAGAPVRVALDDVGDIDVGQTVEVTGRFSNLARELAPPLRDLRLDLQAPDTWAVRPLTADQFGAVRPGQTVETTWAVTRTSSEAGAFPLRAEASYLDSASGEAAQASSVVRWVVDPVVIEPADVDVIQPETLTPVVAEQGAEVYVDRDIVLTRLPEPLAGGVLIPGANDDKQAQQPADYLVFDLARPATVYVAFDQRGEDSWWPSWLLDGGFERTDMTIRTTDPGDPAMVVFAADLPAGRVTLGPNSATSSSSSSYFTVVAAYGR